MKRQPLAVVKFGGSHALKPHLQEWVEALAGCRGGIVIVPGGGPFADMVRVAQPMIGFDDRAAHHMALLAMEQFGIAIAALREAFVCVSTPRAIRSAAADGRVPVWMPTRMVLADAHLPQSWDLTSDSLAAWLAGRLCARCLVMVKHRPRQGGEQQVDPLFEGFAGRARVACTRLEPAEADRLGEAIGWTGDDCGD